MENRFGWQSRVRDDVDEPYVTKKMKKSNSKNMIIENSYDGGQETAYLRVIFMHYLQMKYEK